MRPSRVGGAVSGVVVAGRGVGAADCGAVVVNTGGPLTLADAALRTQGVEGGGGGRVLLCCGAVVISMAGDAGAVLAGGEIWAGRGIACMVLGGGVEGGGTAWKAYMWLSCCKLQNQYDGRRLLMVL